MRMHQVQVDDEVFQLVKREAEPLVDDFNSALRRLLRRPGKQSQTRLGTAAAAAIPAAERVLASLPNGTPIALRHILEVSHLVRGGSYSRTAATQFVAKQHGVFPQTVIDKYCRQLGLTANQFDRLLEEESLAGLRKLLNAKFEAQRDVIDQILG